MNITKKIHKALWHTVFAVGAAGLLAAGCSSPETKTDPVEDTVPAQSEQDIVAEEMTEDDELASGGPGCLVGTWGADKAFFIDQFKELGTAPTEVGGEVIVTFGADGTMSTDYREMSVTFASEGTETTVVRTGVDSGTYEATDTTISMEGTQADSVLTLSMLGTENVMEGVPWDAVDWNYTCVGDQATITGPDSAILLIRKG